MKKLATDCIDIIAIAVALDFLIFKDLNMERTIIAIIMCWMIYRAYNLFKYSGK